MRKYMGNSFEFQPDDGSGKVARYARGSVDYHDLIHGRLKKLKRKLRWSCLPDSSVRGVVDTAPLLEREFAQLAGLGWIGQEHVAAQPRVWQLFLFGRIALGCRAQKNAMTRLLSKNHCGTCTACLDACPTDAFPEPYVLDARRCISYLTIEHRGEIAQELTR